MASQNLMKAWRDGTLAEFALAPVAAISLVEDEAIPVDRLGTLGKLAVPAGGLLRGAWLQVKRSWLSGPVAHLDQPQFFLGVLWGPKKSLLWAETRPRCIM
jgi:hypothetical protein